MYLLFDNAIILWHGFAPVSMVGAMFREVVSPGPSGRGDQSSADRIRDVALKTFAVHGTEATSLRMIAESAGVSIGLVQHHFRTKGNLITAVDDYVMAVLGQLLSGPLPEAPTDPVSTVAQRVTELVSNHAPVIDYMCRAVVDCTPMGVRIFDGLVDIGRGHWDQLAEQGLVRPGLDPDWVALNPMVLVLGIFIVRSHLDRHLPDAFTSPAQLDRWQKATDALIRNGQIVPPEPKTDGG